MAKPKPGQRKGWGNSNASRLSAPRKKPAASTAAPSPTSKPGFFGIGSFGDAAEALSGKGRRRGSPIRGPQPRKVPQMPRTGGLKIKRATVSALPDTAMRRPTTTTTRRAKAPLPKSKMLGKKPTR